MAQTSKIEWTDATINPWWGCSHVHRGCDNCYAEALANRWGKVCWDKEDGQAIPRLRVLSAFNDLESLEKKACKSGQKLTVFIGSMMDIFEKSKPLSNPTDDFKETGDLRAFLFDAISKGCYPNLIFLFLTKRPSNINKMIPEPWLTNHPENVWFGASVVDGQSLNDVARHLDKVNGKTFWSVEPLLEGIDIRKALSNYKWPDWVIVGGESGPKRRPFKLEWAEKISIDCINMEIPYFFKQIDKVIEPPTEMLIRQWPLEFGKYDDLNHGLFQVGWLVRKPGGHPIGEIDAIGPTGYLVDGEIYGFDEIESV